MQVTYQMDLPNLKKNPLKVNFLIVGAQKSGTTALLHFLQEHPQVCMPKQEVHFFDNDKLFEGKTINYNLYHQFFLLNKNTKAIGEKTPIYMYWSGVAERIYNYNSKIKLIFILRNPIERAYSQYIMEKNRNLESLPFFLALRLEKLRRKRLATKQHRVYSYIDRGYYSEQIKNYLRHFSREQMLFIKNEDLKEHHNLTIEKVCKFLDITHIAHSQSRKIHSNNYLPISLINKKYLIKKYKPSIIELEKLLDWDCSQWLKL
jgi:hypothetical protein